MRFLVLENVFYLSAGAFGMLLRVSSVLRVPVLEDKVQLEGTTGNKHVRTRTRKQVQLSYSAA